MSDCKNGGRCSYSDAIASAMHEEYTAQLESRNRALVEFDVNVRQRRIEELEDENTALRKQLDAERDIRARKSARVDKVEAENEKLREELEEVRAERDARGRALDFNLGNIHRLEAENKKLRELVRDIWEFVGKSDKLQYPTIARRVEELVGE